MGKKLSNDHINYVPHSGKAVCYHCGDSYQVTPASLGMVVVILKQYGKEHKRCKKSQRGDDLLAANIAAYEKLDESKKNTIGVISYPEPQNLGEKIAQHLLMEEMSKQDLGNGITMERVKK